MIQQPYRNVYYSSTTSSCSHLSLVVIFILAIAALHTNNMTLTMAFTTPNVLSRIMRPTATSSFRSSLLHVLTPPVPIHPKSTNSQSKSHMSSQPTSKSNPTTTFPLTTILQPLIVCGPSGVGKGTIIEQYMTSPKYNGSNQFGFTVSHTTRNPRPGEVNGIHYHFCKSITDIERSIQNLEFLEYATVHGNIYGTSLESLRHVQYHLGKLPLLDIDVQGVKHIKDYIANTNNDTDTDTPPPPPILKLDATFIFIAPPSLSTLKKRLEGRGTETQESLEKRTLNASNEMEYGLSPGNFDYIIVNDDLDQACHDFDLAIRELYYSKDDDDKDEREENKKGL